MELKLPGHKGIVRSIAFTLDDTRLLSGSAGRYPIVNITECLIIRLVNKSLGCTGRNGNSNSARTHKRSVLPPGYLLLFTKYIETVD